MPRIRNPKSHFAGRGSSFEGTIFGPRRRPLTRADLHRALDPVMREWIDVTCVWHEGGIGDHRFVVFTIDVAPEVQAYLQFWADPLGHVEWEVSSGRWNPPTDTWIAGERAQRIESFGFVIGGHAKNYARSVRIRTDADVARTARTVVDIFYDGFDYRGAQAIDVHFACEGRSLLTEVLDTVSVDDLDMLFTARGFTVESAPRSTSGPAALPMLHCQKLGVVTAVRFDARAAKPGLYRRATLTADLDLTLEQATRLGYAPPPDTPPTPQTFVVKTMLEFSGGVTEAWIVQRISEWDAMIAAQLQSADTRPTSRRRLPHTTVH